MRTSRSCEFRWNDTYHFELFRLLYLARSCLSLPQPFPFPFPIPSHMDCELRLESVSFGVRTVGSAANERQTPAFLVRELEKIKAERGHLWDFEIEVQRPSGHFTTWFLGGFTNVYSRVTNVLVRFSPKTATGKQNAVLVNSHFDTALGTVAASDDAAMCAVMLEVLRNLAWGEPGEPLEVGGRVLDLGLGTSSSISEDAVLKHALIFNFNGAEETNWQAAHGFITQHRTTTHYTCITV